MLSGYCKSWLRAYGLWDAGALKALSLFERACFQRFEALSSWKKQGESMFRRWEGRCRTS